VVTTLEGAPVSVTVMIAVIAESVTVVANGNVVGAASVFELAVVTGETATGGTEVVPVAVTVVAGAIVVVTPAPVQTLGVVTQVWVQAEGRMQFHQEDEQQVA
jgi:hypothetical protein